MIDRLERFLSSDTESVFLLKGYAGTGKTFITKGLTEYFRSIGRNYVLAAPTGKAAKVIGTKTKSPAFTIHKRSTLSTTLPSIAMTAGTEPRHPSSTPSWL